MPLIETTVIPGASVYGVQQVSYTVAGAAGKDYSAALLAATLKESAAIEASAAAYSAVVKERARKIDELGQVMAYLNKAYANLRPKDGESGDTTSIDNSAWVNQTASKYGVTLVFNANTGNMTRGNIMKGQNEVQYVIDTEDNNMQQDIVAMQGLITKRDNAFSSASRIVRKSDDAASSVIHNIV